MKFLLSIILSLSIYYSDQSAGSEFDSFHVEQLGSGEPMILIPGLMSDGRVWNDVIEKFSDKYEIHIIEVAGFGRTAGIENQSLLRVRNELLSYIRDNNLYKPIIVGHSLGGFLAFWLASESPAEIGPIVSMDGLPFIGPVFSGDNSQTVESMEPQAEQLKSFYASMSKHQLTSQVKYGISRQASNESAYAMILDMAETSDPETVGDAMYRLMQTDLRNDIHRIESRVLLLGASGNANSKEVRTHVRSVYQEQLTALQSVQLEMNKNAKHFIMLDDPLWVEQKILDFLGSEQ